MPQCPVCQAELTEDFGMVDCSSCGTPLSIQIDGSVESTSHPSAADVDGPLIAAPDDIQGEIDFSSDEAELTAIATEAPSVDDYVDGAAVLGSDEEMASPPPLPESPSTASYEDLEDFVSNEAAPTLAAAAPNASPDLSDLSQFANSVESGAQGGMLRYNLLISGIDTADVRAHFRDAINDRKFVWDSDAILKSIRSGTVRIDNVTAVKALLLIQRLRELPVDVQWEQHAVHQA